MVAYKADASADPQRVKVVRARPKAAVEGCYDRATPPRFVAEPLVVQQQAGVEVQRAVSCVLERRHEAGGPLAANILKCQLKPIDARDYPASMAASDLARLKVIFPDGVCDWSKSGVNQVPVTPWASFGPCPNEPHRRGAAALTATIWRSP